MSPWRLLLLTSILALSTQSLASSEQLRSRLLVGSHQAPSLELQKLIDLPTLRGFYKARNFELAWMDQDGLRAISLMQFIQTAEQHGLRSYDYLSGSVIDAFALAGTELSDTQAVQLDMAISAAALRYLHDLRFGRVTPTLIDPKWRYERAYEDIGALLNGALQSPQFARALDALAPSHISYRNLQNKLFIWRDKQFNPRLPLIADGPLLKPGMSDPRVQALRSRLGLPARASSIFDGKLKNAVMRFQKAHGLTPDALIGEKTIDALNRRRDDVVATLRANLERQRWYGHENDERHLLVNIPDYSLSAIENQQSVLQMRAIVGQEERETPLINSQVNRIVFKPYWRVPHSIVIRDLLPKFKANPDYASRRGFEFLQAWGGEPIPQQQINWAQLNESNFVYKVRQRPGPLNALGNIKFLFPNPYAVYIHDTAARSLFGTSNRSYSSGCVRIEKPRALFDWLTQDAEAWAQNMDTDQLDTIYKLEQTVAVKIRYRTAWVDENNDLQIRRDIYGLDAKLLGLLDQTEVAVHSDHP